MGSARSPRYRRFLKRLRQARLEAHLTQPQVAAALKRPQSFVSKCESGERRIDVIELLDLARLYRKPIGYFIGH
jgi:transcriptional regulator with XRE-family HTH domain